MTHSSGKNRIKGFTLVELIMVMAIMIVVMGMVVVAFPSLGKAGNLTNGAASFVDILNLARQTALAQNRTVEVRFYYLPGLTDGSTPTAYRAMRMITADPSGNTSTNVGSTTVFASAAQPGLVKQLPTGVIVYSGTSGSYTTILPVMTPGSPPSPNWPSGITTLHATTGTEYFPGSTTQIAYAAFQFKPTGGTTLDPLGTLGTSGTNSNSDKWFMSFKNQNDFVITGGSAAPAQNFVTVLIDPVTGRVRTYRPGG